MRTANPKALLYSGHDDHAHPNAVPAATGYTTGLDRRGYDWAYIVPLTGASTGNPTTSKFQVQVQDDDKGDAGGSAGDDYTDVPGALTAVTQENGQAVLEVDLRGLDRYIRLKNTISFTGGVNPTLYVSAAVLLFNKAQLPAVSQS